MKAKGFCIVCGEEIEVNICCNGYMCGCMGQPVDPPVCSEECYDELMGNMQKYYPSTPARTVKEQKDESTDG